MTTSLMRVSDTSRPNVREARRRAIAAMYGDACPMLVEGQVTADEFVSWAKALWERHSPSVQSAVHTAERNRLFRQGLQWVSSQGQWGPWRPVPRSKDKARVVVPLIDKVLDQRLQVLVEQRPGFRMSPANRDPDKLAKAEAQQAVVEYLYDQCHMERTIAEAAYWAGTDGVAFLYGYWDADAGPTAELPIGDEQSGQRTLNVPLGDFRTQVFRIEQVRVSSNATATRKPFYWVVREVVSKAEAVATYGLAVADVATDVLSQTDATYASFLDSLTMDTVGDDRMEDQSPVDKFMVFGEPSEFFPQGFQFVVVGDTLAVPPSPLPTGMVPLVRFSDGSTDPAFYPRPQMNGWIEHQMRINALVSQWIDGVRKATGALITRKGSLQMDTLEAGPMVVWETADERPFGDLFFKMDSSSVGNDLRQLLEFEIRLFENATSWNDTSRGSISSDRSGRSILAQREMLERAFAPGVRAASEAMSRWAEIALAFCKWGYDYPRQLQVVGVGRPDLAREVSREDFDGVASVFVDPETLVPLPRAFRQALLDQMLERGVMTPQEYRRRMPFSYVQNMQTPDDDQQARAERVADAIIEQRNDVPEMRWTDNESIHQDVLERRILVRDEHPPEVVQMAMERWTQLANQAQQKQGVMAGGTAPGMPPMGGAESGGPPSATPLPPSVQPTPAMNAGVAGQPLALSPDEANAQAMDTSAQGF